MIFVAPATTSFSLDVLIVDDTGLPVTGLVAATFPTTKYCLGGPNADATISLSDLSAITDAYSSGGVFERGEGVYRLDVPNAALASAGVVTVRGEASGKRIIAPRIQVSTEYSRLDDAVSDAVTAAAAAAVSAGTAATNSTTLLSRIGAFTGSGINTILGFFQALFRSDASAPTDVGGTFDPSTDSTQAIRDRGDVAWVTGSSATAAEIAAALSGTAVVISRVAADGSVEIVRGDDYSASDSWSLDWTDTNENWPTLTSATISIAIKDRHRVTTLLTGTGSVVVATGTGKKVRWEPTAAETATLAEGIYTIEVTATLSSGRVRELVRGKFTLLAR